MKNKNTDYENKLEKLQGLQNELAKTQRERDLKIDTVNNEYQLKLDRILRKIDVAKIEIAGYKKIVSEYPSDTDVKQIALDKLLGGTNE